MSVFNWSLFHELPVVGILRGYSEEELHGIIPAVCEGGLTTIEVTMNSANPLLQIDLIAELAGDQMNVGAGTVLTVDQCQAALAAGASYIVTPVVNPEVINFCVKEKVPVFPGAFTPTEVWQAWSLGATMVKLFPANQLGPSYLKDIKGPLNEVKLLATGGVKPENLADFHAAGASGFGVGSPLFHKDRVAAKDWACVRSQAERFVTAWKSIPSQTNHA